MLRDGSSNRCSLRSPPCAALPELESRLAAPLDAALRRGVATPDVPVPARGASRPLSVSVVDGVRDTFVFAKGDSGSTKQGASTWDKVFDFRSRVDKIDLSAIDADTYLSGSQDLRFVTNFTKAVAKDRVANGQYRLVDSGANYKVEIDYNGDTTADMVISVMNVASLKAGNSGDFLL